MTVNLIESWNGIDNFAEMVPKWTSEGGAPLNSGAGRFGETNGSINQISSGYAVSADPLNPGTSDKLIIGFGYKTDATQVDIVATAPWTIVEFRHGTDQMCKIVLNADNTISAVTDAAVQHTSLHTVLAQTWHYIEVKILLNNGAGTCQFQIDGAVGEAEGTNLDTLFNGSACDNVRWISTGTNEDWALDDCYLGDSSPAGAMDFLGDTRVITLLPDGDDSVQFTPTEGDNHSGVDDTQTVVADTTYNESNTSGHKDLFTMSASGIDPADTIHGITVNMWTQKVDAGAADMRLELDSNAVTDTSSAFTQTTSYGWFSKFHPLNIDGNVAWTSTTVDAVKAGYSRV